MERGAAVVRGLKVLLVVLALLPLAAPDLPPYQGKAMAARAVTFPLAALVVPFVWRGLGRPRPYPLLADALFVLPFVLDLAGNALDLYDPIEVFDDVLHWVNWVLLSCAMGEIICTAPVGRLNAAALVAGAGTIANVLWELAEWVVMTTGAGRLGLTYRDTIGDLALSTLGAFTAAAITAKWLWPRHARARPNPQ